MPELTDIPWRSVTRQRLNDLGFSDSRIAALVRAGVLRRVVQGVYVRADLPDTVELRASAAGLVVAPHHVVVDRTAAWLHGVDVFTYAERQVLPSIETCALRGRHPTERTGVRGRTRDLVPNDIMTISGLRVTTPLRTALDLACNLHRRDAFAALNMLARRHGLDRGDFQRELLRLRRRRGVIQSRELVALLDPRLESHREYWTLLAILDVGLPAPEPQYWIYIDGIPTYRLDLAYPQCRICIEYDGFDAHERTEEQREYDRRRRKWLRDNSWTVVVVRRGDFTGTNLDSWLREVEAALRPSYSNRRW